MLAYKIVDNYSKGSNPLLQMKEEFELIFIDDRDSSDNVIKSCKIISAKIGKQMGITHKQYKAFTYLDVYLMLIFFK